MGACRSCWRPRSAPSRSSTTFRRPTFGRRWPHSQGSALTSETSAPYNGSAMTVDDPAITGAIRRHEERLQRDPESLAFAQLAELTSILGESPKEAQAHRLSAEIHRLRGDLDAAAHHLDAAARLDPTDRESRALLGLLRAAPHAGEISGLARVLADDTFVTTAFGALCLDQGLTEEALNIFIRILRKEPNNADARAGLEGALRARLKRRG